MHMQNLAKELLYSLPVEVEFAGFRGNTLDLAMSGWELSMRQHHSAWGSGLDLQLAMKIGAHGSEVFALSSAIHVDYAQVHAISSSKHAYAEFLAKMRFNIQYISNNLQFQIIPIQSSSSFLNQWDPVDPFPQERDEERIDIRSFKFFKVGNRNIKDLIVAPHQVPELLDLVLKAQAPMLKEIKARENSRANMEQFKPAHQVQAQIITLA